jgi:hypothetical protein
MPEQNLWRSVVSQAVHDAFSKNEYHRWRAWVWVYHRSRDYSKVCDLAGISADRLRETMIETIFLNYLIQKGGFSMSNLTIKPIKTTPFKVKRGHQKTPQSLAEKFDTARRAKSILRAIYGQQELKKAIGSLTLHDIINICKQSECELDAEMEAYND